jgi:hypothetical protein
MQEVNLHKLTFIHQVSITFVCINSCSVVTKISVIVFLSLFVCDVEGRAKLPPCLIKYHAVKMYGGVEVELRSFLISILGGGDRGLFPWE